MVGLESTLWLRVPWWADTGRVVRGINSVTELHAEEDASRLVNRRSCRIDINR